MCLSICSADFFRNAGSSPGLAAALLWQYPGMVRKTKRNVPTRDLVLILMEVGNIAFPFPLSIDQFAQQDASKVPDTFRNSHLIHTALRPKNRKTKSP